MKREAMLKRLERAGLCGRVTVLEATTAELLLTWLTPLLRDHETIEQLKDAGAQWVYGDDPEVTRKALKAHRDSLGDRVCGLWPFEPFAAEIDLEDFADHFDDLWYPAADDVWLFLFHPLRVAITGHFGGLVGRWRALRAKATGNGAA